MNQWALKDKGCRHTTTYKYKYKYCSFASGSLDWIDDPKSKSVHPAPDQPQYWGEKGMTQEGNRINQRYVVMYTVESIIHRKLYTRSPLAPFTRRP